LHRYRYRTVHCGVVGSSGVRDGFGIFSVDQYESKVPVHQKTVYLRITAGLVVLLVRFCL
jgi:hypothetical protein